MTTIDRLTAAFPACTISDLGEGIIKLSWPTIRPRYRTIDVADLSEDVLSAVEAVADGERRAVLNAALDAKIAAYDNSGMADWLATPMVD